MADKLLIITNDNTATSRIYVGDTVDPTTLALKTSYDALSTGLVRCHIKTGDTTKMLVGSSSDIFYSADSGDNWSAATVPTMPGPPIGYGYLRCLNFFGTASAIYAYFNNALFLSTDDGVNFSDISSTLPSYTGYLVDHIALTDTTWLILTDNFSGGDLTGGGKLWRTADSGGTWTQVADLSTYSGWTSLLGTVFNGIGGSASSTSSEVPRRIRKYTSANDLLLLTSHKLWRLQWNGSSYDGTILWDFIAYLDANYPVSGETWARYAGSVNNEGIPQDQFGNILDDLHVDEATGRVWICGYNNARFHSFDLVNFILSDPNWANFTNLSGLPDREMICPINGWTQFITNARTGLPTLTNEPGVFKSTDGGVSASSHKAFSGAFLEHAEHAWAAIFPPPTAGCTIPTACNYDPAAEVDDGSCQQSVALTDCVSSDVIYTSTPEIFSLGCRMPRFMIDIQQLTGSPQGLNLYANAAGIVAISTFLDEDDPNSLVDFIQMVVTNINSFTSFTAVQVPYTQNTLVPGSPYGIWITAPDMTYAGVSVSELHFNIDGVTIDLAFDSGSNGAVVQVAEYPTRCFKVCGTGNCAMSIPLTLTGTYADCFRCVPITPTLACLNCESQVSIGGTPLITSSAPTSDQCVSAGDVVDLTIQAGFPVLVSTTIVPLEVGTGCTGACPVTLTFVGDQQLEFPVGSTFQINPSTNIYTVATVSYDIGTDVTTVITVEDCQGESGIEDVDSFTGCTCNAILTITNTDTSVVLVNAQYDCVDSYISQDTTWTVPAVGNYLISIVAQQCGQSRTCTFYLKACPSFTIVETGCHEFTINANANASDPSVTNTITVTDLSDNSKLVDAVAVAGDDMPYAFTGTSDSVYKVEVSNGLSTTSYITEVIDLCDSRTCRDTIIQEILCGEEDPCDQACDMGERDRKRYEINRISLAWSQLERLVHNYRYAYLGIPSYSATRIEDLQQIASVVEKLRSMSSECGECHGTTNTDPCTTC